VKEGISVRGKPKDLSPWLSRLCRSWNIKIFWLSTAEDVRVYANLVIY